jgi:endonuclease YncB( thermonuclease family)
LATIVVVLILVAYSLWRGSDGTGSGSSTSQRDAPRGESPPTEQAHRPSGSYSLLSGAVFKPHRANDGDSFHIDWNGETHVFRLYFVDCPETSDRYPDRLDYQARYFGIENRRDVMALGREARSFTQKLLESQPFEVWTRWESVMDSDRIHAFIRFPDKQPGGTWLCEALVEAGLARIYTLPADLPDGTPKAAFRNHLRSLEREAKRKQAGAWSR